MKATVQPSTISGTITAPASKSAMQRACAAALIKGGSTVLQNPGSSADDKAALGIIRQLGATIRYDGGALVIESSGVKPVGHTVDCNESGLSVRMFTSIAALSEAAITVNGSGSLLKRPVSFFDAVLPRLGVTCSSQNGLLPLQVKGPLQPQDITVDGSVSSQFLTGLLFAYAAADASNVTIRVDDLNSKPYIDLTLQVMSDFGLKTPVNHNYAAFSFGPPSIPVATADTIYYTVESDWSGAAFLLVAGAIAAAGEGIVVEGLDVFSTQADKAVLQALMQTGAVMSIEQERIMIRAQPLKAFHIDATDCPDLFPPLVALASYCSGTSVIEGVGRLAHKESNRALTLQEEFGRMGVGISLQDDLMIIRNEGVVRGAAVHSHHDHRIAMACAVAALKAEGTTEIEGAEAVNKSYPQFWEHLQQLNAQISSDQSTTI